VCRDSFQKPREHENEAGAGAVQRGHDESCPYKITSAAFVHLGLALGCGGWLEETVEFAGDDLGPGQWNEVAGVNDENFGLGN
jgi:hypothetical protein